MQTEHVIEGTVAESPQAKPEPSSWEPVVREAAQLFETLGKAIVNTAQDISSLMVIQVDGDTRERLDMLVEAGVAKSRREGAQLLINEGAKTKQEIFDKVERTHAQIQALKAQMRSLVAITPTE